MRTCCSTALKSSFVARHGLRPRSIAASASAVAFVAPRSSYLPTACGVSPSQLANSGWVKRLEILHARTSAPDRNFSDALRLPLGMIFLLLHKNNLHLRSRRDGYLIRGPREVKFLFVDQQDAERRLANHHHAALAIGAGVIRAGLPSFHWSRTTSTADARAVGSHTTCHFGGLAWRVNATTTTSGSALRCCFFFTLSPVRWLR